MDKRLLDTVASTARLGRTEMGLRFAEYGPWRIVTCARGGYSRLCWRPDTGEHSPASALPDGVERALCAALRIPCQRIP
jgi:hypothetical protein